MIEAVIIDDETNWRLILKTLLKKFPNVKVVGEADSVSSGIEMIERVAPNLIFLDVQMHGETGFDLLRNVRYKDFAVIFTTAHDEYAVNAFKVEAVDYLQKPIDGEELADAIRKAETKRNQFKNVQGSLDVLVKKLQKVNEGVTRIALNTKEGIQFVLLSDIIRCESDLENTTFYLKGGRALLTPKKIKEYEFLLDQSNFFKVHRFHIVNLNCVSKLTKNGFLSMEDDSQVPISSKSKSGFLKKLLNK